MTKVAPFVFPKGFSAPHELSGMPADTPLLLGFSGGADSSALLCLLAAYAKQHGTPLSVAHVNHGIRGADANRDEAFCREAAERLGLPFYVLHANVPEEAIRKGESIETCARRVRYEWFDRIMREREIPLLATAHNANDNLETVLFNMVRGSGLGGICGIPACRQTAHGLLIRPILRMEKEDILALCEREKISFVTDCTNTDTDYTRNRIRAELVPTLKEINPGAVRNVSHLCESLHEDSLCLLTMTNWFLEELRKENAIEVEKLCGSPPAIVNRALLLLFTEASEGQTLEYTHMVALRKLAKEAVPHSSVSLPGHMEAVIENGCLVFRKREEPQKIPDYAVELKEGSNLISQTNAEIVIGNSQKTINIYKKSILLYLDSATINGTLTARRRRGGDRLRCGGMTKSVKKLFCDKKIPLALRDRIPILCDRDGIVAVPFVAVRDGAENKVKDTNSSLCIQIYL